MFMLRAHDANDKRERVIDKIEVDRIKPNPYQPRRIFQDTAIEELAQSIRVHGLLQPITVRKTGPRDYELIAGERRLRAARLAGLVTIDAIIMRAYDRDSALMALIENLQRENLHFLEEAEACQAAISEHSLTQEELARQLGKTQSSIANKLRILRLPYTIRERIRREGLTERHARALLRIHDIKTQEEVLEKIITLGANVKDSEELVEQAVQGLYSMIHPAEDGKSPEKETVKKGRVTHIVRDVRIYTNSIRTVVRRLENAGAPIRMMQQQNGNTMKITIEIG